MSDLFIFVFGILVTAIVGASVTLLLWGAANETEDGELSDQVSQRSVPVQTTMKASRQEA